MSFDAPDSEEVLECPICLDELDITDRSFRPCKCGYQMCRFCFNTINENLNGKCPACRTPYNEENFQFEAPKPEECARFLRKLCHWEILARQAVAKKAKERDKKQVDVPGRRQLNNVRVIQRNLVYVTNLAVTSAKEEILRRNDYFGRFGKINKIVVNKNHIYNGPQGPSVSSYVTYYKEPDSAAAIKAMDGLLIDGRNIRCSFGTTKYCAYFLRGVRCPNPDCMYLHELGEEVDSFTKEDMQQAAGKHMGPSEEELYRDLRRQPVRRDVGPLSQSAGMLPIRPGPSAAQPAPKTAPAPWRTSSAGPIPEREIAPAPASLNPEEWPDALAAAQKKKLASSPLPVPTPAPAPAPASRPSPVAPLTKDKEREKKDREERERKDKEERARKEREERERREKEERERREMEDRERKEKEERERKEREERREREQRERAQREKDQRDKEQREKEQREKEQREKEQREKEQQEKEQRDKEADAAAARAAEEARRTAATRQVPVEDKPKVGRKANMKKPVAALEEPSVPIPIRAPIALASAVVPLSAPAPIAPSRVAVAAPPGLDSFGESEDPTGFDDWLRVKFNDLLLDPLATTEIAPLSPPLAPLTATPHTQSGVYTVAGVNVPQRSRFRFAQEDELESGAATNPADVEAEQNSFRALFPNVNISFTPKPFSASTPASAPPAPMPISASPSPAPLPGPSSAGNMLGAAPSLGQVTMSLPVGQLTQMAHMGQLGIRAPAAYTPSATWGSELFGALGTAWAQQQQAAQQVQAAQAQAAQQAAYYSWPAPTSYWGMGAMAAPPPGL